jgi:hypothetical protein
MKWSMKDFADPLPDVPKDGALLSSIRTFIQKSAFSSISESSNLSAASRVEGFLCGEHEVNNESSLKGVSSSEVPLVSIDSRRVYLCRREDVTL